MPGRCTPRRATPSDPLHAARAAEVTSVVAAGGDRPTSRALKGPSGLRAYDGVEKAAPLLRPPFLAWYMAVSALLIQGIFIRAVVGVDGNAYA